MPPPLLLSRRFAPLFWCQFFAAFNDNFLKTALVFVILFHDERGDHRGAMQKFGATVPVLFLSIGVATLLVALAILKTMPKAE